MTDNTGTAAVWPSTDSDLPEALDDMIDLIQTMPGAFRGEFQLGYWGGVTEGADAWSVRVEADIEDAEFFLTGAAPSETLRRAIEETKRRIARPTDNRSHIWARPSSLTKLKERRVGWID